MTILFLDQFSEPGGAQQNLLALLPFVVGRGWRPHVAIPHPGRLSAAFDAMSVPVHELPLRPYSHGLKSPADLVSFLRDLQPLAAAIRSLSEKTRADLIYVNGPRLMPAAALARSGRPVVFHAHNRVGFWSGSSLLRWSARAANADVIAASRFAAEGYTRAHVVYSGVAGPPVARPHGGSFTRVGMIGRMDPQKRQREFVLAAREHAGIQFVLCGDSLFGDRDAERYKDDVLSLAGPNVEWLGWRESIHEVLASLDLLIVPSENEGGVPRVILEAFAFGVPVLACASGAVTEAVFDGVNGFLLPRITSESLARAIRTLSEQRDRRMAVAIQARRDWELNFQVSRYGGEICSLLDSVRAR
jgi:glycosyltransferase involved in cell wall biosynthesis